MPSFTPKTGYQEDIQLLHVQYTNVQLQQNSELNTCTYPFSALINVWVTEMAFRL